MYRFSNKTDKFYLIIGIICAIAIGTAFPIFSLLWGNMIDSFSNKDKMVAGTLKVLFNYI